MKTMFAPGEVIVPFEQCSKEGGQEEDFAIVPKGGAVVVMTGDMDWEDYEMEATFIAQKDVKIPNGPGDCDHALAKIKELIASKDLVRIGAVEIWVGPNHVELEDE